MCNNKDLLDNFVELDSAVKVQVGGGKTLNANGRGTVTLLTILPGGKHKKCKLKNVFVVPQPRVIILIGSRKLLRLATQSVSRTVSAG